MPSLPATELPLRHNHSAEPSEHAEVAPIPAPSSYSTPASSSKQSTQSSEVAATELIFLGTGTSGCVPVVQCLTVDHPSCHTCTSPLKENKRLNTSCILRVQCPPPENSSSTTPIYKNLMIDAGKTIYPAALNIFPRYKIRTIDALVLTHAHADAIFGLDDLRSWTLPGPRSTQNHIDVYCSATTMSEVARTFPYLVDKNQATGGGDVPSFVWHVFDENESFRIPSCGNIEVVPLPVEHGRYLSTGNPFWNLGFRIGGFSYISDCSGVPEETKRKIKGSRVVVQDGLKWDPHASHWSIEQSRTWVRDELGSGVALKKRTTTKETNGESAFENGEPWSEDLGPQSTWLTGFSHAVEHVEATKEFSAWGKRDGRGMYVRPAWDGLRLGIDGRPIPES